MNTYRVTKNEKAGHNASCAASRAVNAATRQLASRGRRGSTLIEFALVLPILLLLTMGILQYGLIMNATNTLSQITREGARYAAINPGSGSADDNQKIKDYISSVCAPTTIRYSDIQNGIVIATPDGVNKGNRISVTITYPMSRKRFLPARFFGVTIFASNYTTVSTFAIE